MKGTIPEGGHLNSNPGYANSLLTLTSDKSSLTTFLYQQSMYNRCTFLVSFFWGLNG
jgi:hypothetical protein